MFSYLLSLELDGSIPVMVPGQVCLLLLPLVLVLHIVMELLRQREVWALELTWTRKAIWILTSVLLTAWAEFLVALRPTPLFFIT